LNFIRNIANFLATIWRELVADGSNEFKLKFGGDLHEVNARVLIKSLIGVTTVIEELNREIYGGRKIEVRVKALEKGSFLIDLVILPDSIKDLLASISLEHVYQLVGSLVGIFTLKKLFGAKKPTDVIEEGGKYKINTERGNAIIIDKPTYNFYNTNKKANDAIAETFECLNSEPAIKSFDILDAKDRSLLDVARNDFDELSKLSVEIKEGKFRIIREITAVNIFKVVVEQEYKWGFYYKGRIISANIVDKDFFKKIDSGEQFAKGDSLRVELEIKQEFRESVNTYVNKSYQINRVIEHIPRPPQGKLDLK